MIGNALAMIVLLAAAFFAAVICLATDSGLRARSMQVSAAAAILIGSVMYGYGYAVCQGLNMTSLLRALLALCRMFGGINDLAAIETAPLMKYPAAQAVF